jgi:general secretion pathway protein J
MRLSRGMTLIEVMVALALLALLSLGIVTSFRLGGRSYRQVTASVVSDREVLRAQRFLRQIIESSYPFRQPAGARDIAFGLEGTATELQLTAPMPQASGGSGNYRYELLEEEGERGLKRLLVRWSLDRHGSLASTSTMTAGPTHDEVLLDGIESLDWAYLAPADALTEARWSASWTGNPKPPALVRLRMRFPSGDRRRWPELIIGPRVTDDSSCRFDAVSQSCRES